MGRIRTLKPEMAKHELLYDLEREAGLPIRFAWAMLPTACDREGRFKWLPRTLKADILPHDEVDFSRVLHAWLTRGFVVRYRVGNEWFGWVPTFRKHQVINNREVASELPSIEEADEVQDYRNQPHPDACGTRAPREDDATSTRVQSRKAEGKGREGKGREGKNPPSGGPGGGESDDDRPAPKHGSPIPSPFVLNADMRAWAATETPGLDIERATREFVDYWRSLTGAKARKADWTRTWQVRMRDLHDRGRYRLNGHTGPQRAPTVDADGIPTWATAEERAEILAARALEGARADH